MAVTLLSVIVSSCDLRQNRSTGSHGFQSPHSAVTTLIQFRGLFRTSETLSLSLAAGRSSVLLGFGSCCCWCVCLAEAVFIYWFSARHRPSPLAAPKLGAAHSAKTTRFLAIIHPKVHRGFIVALLLLHIFYFVFYFTFCSNPISSVGDLSPKKRRLMAIALAKNARLP